MRQLCRVKNTARQALRGLAPTKRGVSRKPRAISARFSIAKPEFRNRSSNRLSLLLFYTISLFIRKIKNYFNKVGGSDERTWKKSGMPKKRALAKSTKRAYKSCAFVPKMKFRPKTT
ncbi:MAG: hypothetical protein IJV64_13070, partial [Oscillospiraceae bacterium]|nr:hypothetical protein [Oscillospiraceae bacterium]